MWTDIKVGSHILISRLVGERRDGGLLVTERKQGRRGGGLQVEGDTLSGQCGHPSPWLP